MNTSLRSLLPAFPFASVTQLFLEPADSDLRAFLEETHALCTQFPELIDAVEADLDRHAIEKKSLRIADERWFADHSRVLPGLLEPTEGTGKPLTLEHGRPRTPGYVVLIAMLLRGYWGAGFKSEEVTSMMTESITLRIFFANLSLKMSGRSTLSELVNAISNETRLRVLDAQVARAMHLQLDDFSICLQDSTHVEGNTAWPTDSRLMVELVRRLMRVGGALDCVGLPSIESPVLDEIVFEMEKSHRKIEFSNGKKDSKRERIRCYKRLLRLSKRVFTLFKGRLPFLETALDALDVPPSKKRLAAHAIERLRADLDTLSNVRTICEARVLRDEKVPMSEKVLSLCDPDVGFIAKGQRDPVIGYKPQLARSGEGFIVGLHLPERNASDAPQLVPMLDDVIARTGVTPKVVSVDDGYSSSNNFAALRQRNIEVISMNGAKGRALTAAADWQSDVFAEARNKRSAVESLIFTLKQGFHFGEVARRGRSSVFAELLEKALAYNLCVTTRLRSETKTKAPLCAARSLA